MAHKNFPERRAAMSRLLAAGVKPDADLLKKLAIGFACDRKHFTAICVTSERKRPGAKLIPARIPQASESASSE